VPFPAASPAAAARARARLLSAARSHFLLFHLLLHALLALLAWRERCGHLPLPLSRAQERAYCFACVAFATSFVISALTLAWSTHPVKRAVTLRVCQVNYAALVTYCLQFSRRAPALVPGLGASPQALSPLRFFMWCFTTPILFAIFKPLLGRQESRARAALRRGAAADLALIVLGAAEALTPRARPALQAALFLAASCAFGETLRCARVGAAGAAAAVSDDTDASTIRRLQACMVVTWLAFPLARAAAVAGYLDDGGLEVAYTVCDVAAKILYCVLVMVCQFQLVDNTTAARLRRAEELLAALREGGGGGDGGGVAAQIAAAHAEAEAWRRDRLGRLGAAGVPLATASAFLDAAVSEYVALAAGRLGGVGRFGLPRLAPPTA